MRGSAPFRHLAPLLGLALAGWTAGCGAAADAGERDRARGGAEGEPAPASWGAGFVVWESNRSGAFRIWRRELQGGPAVRLTPDEPGRDHCCAHVSPDGQRFAYLSVPGGSRKYLPPDTRGELHVALADGSLDRVVATAARHYGEHRAAVWWGPDELVYLDGEGATVHLDLANGRRRRLLPPTGEAEGCLIDPTGRWATGGTTTFSAIGPSGALVRATPLGGCQPYFDPSGRLGYWSAGAGGPIDAIDLASRSTWTIVAKGDPRLPPDRGYVYFPMLSPDGSLLALAGSDGGHDHFRADYDVVVLEVDSATLEPLGRALLITEHPAVDRFPAPFRALPPPRRERPAEAAATATPAPGGGWPAARDALAFAWESATAPNRIAPGAPSDVLEPTGRAAFDRLGRMSFGGGSFAADGAVAERVLAALRGANTMTFEALVEAAPDVAPGAPVAALGVRPGRRSFLLGWRAGRLDLTLRTAETGPAGGAPLELAELAPGGAPRHVAWTYSPGRLRTYEDGRERRALTVPGDFFHWKDGTLLFGAEPGSDARFRGSLSHVAIHARELRAAEVAADAERALAALLAVPQVPFAEVEARLVARSRVPSLEEISPYRSALATEEWEVVRTLAGATLSGRIRVARWMLLDGRATLESREPPGTLRRLRIEPFSAQPQLESMVLSDTLPPAPAGTPPLGFDVAWSGG